MKDTAFKEKSANHPQFYRNEKGEWIECNENTISSLWQKWMASNKEKSKTYDKDGFLVFDYIN